MCIDPVKKEARPVYVEPRVITSPFPLIAEPPTMKVAPQVITK